MTNTQIGETVVLNTTETGKRGSPPVIVLHGLFGSSTNWRSISRALSDDYRVIAADMRNHGKSPWSENMGYKEMAGDVALLIDRFKLNNPVIIGHSMGGKTAMALSQLGLSQIRKMIVADIAPIAYHHTHEDYITALQRVRLEGISSRTDVDRQLVEAIPEAGIRQFLLQNLSRGESGYAWQINLQAIHENLKDLLDYQIDQPSNTETLFIAGGNSSYILPESELTIKTLFPYSKIQKIKNAGHWLHAEQPQRFMELVRTFLSE